MNLKIVYAPGATPLDPDEIAGLIPDYVTTQGELNALEQANILEAKTWAFGKRHRSILTDAFIRDLHKRMFKNVWKWAGKYRLSDKSIGVPWQQVSVELRKLCEDAEYWIQHRTFEWDELATRFHHKIPSSLGADTSVRQWQWPPFPLADRHFDGDLRPGAVHVGDTSR